MSEGCVSIGFMSHLPVYGEQPVVRCRSVSLRRSVLRWRVLTRRLWRGSRPTGQPRLPARGMSTACFLPGTSWSTGSTGLPSRAGRNSRPGSAPASESWPSRRIGRSDGTLPPKSARSCGRPRPSPHERLDVQKYVPDAANVVGGLTQAQIDQVESPGRVVLACGSSTSSWPIPQADRTCVVPAAGAFSTEHDREVSAYVDGEEQPSPSCTAEPFPSRFRRP